MLLLLGRRAVRCGAYALRRQSTRAPRIRATAADEVDLPYRGVLADLRLPDSLTNEDAFDAWAAEREERWTRDGALSGSDGTRASRPSAALAPNAMGPSFSEGPLAGDAHADARTRRGRAEGTRRRRRARVGCRMRIVYSETETFRRLGGLTPRRASDDARDDRGDAASALPRDDRARHNLCDPC